MELVRWSSPLPSWRETRCFGIFPDWNSLKNALGEAFGPFNADEEYWLALFSLSQNGTLDAYIEEFTRLSLSVADLDQLSRAMLFTRGREREREGEGEREGERERGNGD